MLSMGRQWMHCCGLPDTWAAGVGLRANLRLIAVNMSAMRGSPVPRLAFGPGRVLLDQLVWLERTVRAKSGRLAPTN